MYEQKKVSINSWAVEDRPRERLLARGKRSLSNAELLGIIIGSGSKEHSAIDIAKVILNHYEDNLSAISRLKVKDLTKFKGIGPAKAINIIAAFELGKRTQTAEKKPSPTFTKSYDGYLYLKDQMTELDHEEFWVLYLSRANKIIAKDRISVGGVSTTIVDPKILFKKAIDNLASCIILAHNHPSGNLRPSQSDIAITRKIVSGAKFFDMKVLDHIIISSQGYYSFADEGIL